MLYLGPTTLKVRFVMLNQPKKKTVNVQDTFDKFAIYIELSEKLFLSPNKLINIF